MTEIKMKEIKDYCQETGKTWKFKRYGNIAIIHEFVGDKNE